MKHKLYLEVNLPDNVDLKLMDIEQLIYNELSYRLDEIGISKEVKDDYEQFDVYCKDIKYYYGHE